MGKGSESRMPDALNRRRALTVIRTKTQTGVAGWLPVTVVIGPRDHVARPFAGDGRVVR